MRTTVAFVCQRGPIEFKSVLLAASLRDRLRGQYELVACIPAPRRSWGSPSDITLRCLAALGVRTATTQNPIGADYAIGNKVGAAAVPTDSERVVLLDSDIICLRELVLDRCFDGDFRAKPADLCNFPATDAVWDRLYSHFGLPAPTERLSATVSGDAMRPYFNAGVVAFRTGRGFPEAWAECCREIDRDVGLPGRRPHLDQIALPIGVARCGLRCTPLPDCLNFPAHMMPITSAVPVLCHYHSPNVLRREPRLVRRVTELLERHSALREVLARSSCREVLVPVLPTPVPRPPALWMLRRAVKLLSCRRRRRSRIVLAASVARPRAVEVAESLTPPDGLVTGVPRSGTSYLCSCLHRLPNQVAINEPAEVFGALEWRRPWGVPVMHADLRARILAGEAVENKMRGRNVVEDTARRDVRSSYRPVISRSDFGLWTKNTLAYLARLAQLREVMPSAPIVACIRHPFDTIGSWIGSFPHLRDAAVDSFPVGGPHDPWIGDEVRDRVRLIASCTDPSLRRALLWRHLATWILEGRTLVTIVRYEDLVSQPATTVARIVGMLPGEQSSEGLDGISPSAPSRSGTRLAARDRDAIRSTCADVASSFGYEL
jgi:hypothetical protein